MTIVHCNRTHVCSNGATAYPRVIDIHGAIEQHQVASDALTKALTGVVNEETTTDLTDLSVLWSYHSITWINQRGIARREVPLQPPLVVLVIRSNRERTVTMTDDGVRDACGQFAEETTDDEILTAMREVEFPAVTARWGADTLAMERPSAHRRLEELLEEGEG
ncbi:hypothetical protein [Haladaptatus salinisoli]|uniref:hypothetical protein n=1 Tax=Haladaptatus salinisoli TaxID=2884876 RepID=UPI001D0B357B|nr:hypothetical protein [Haladaptatus salinisoli]